MNSISRKNIIVLGVENCQLKIVWKLSRVLGIENWKFTKKAITNKILVVNSTAGYCQDISRLQFRHLPFNKIKLNKGTLSYQAICFLHFGQIERPKIVFFWFSRQTRQLIKLPTQRPKINMIKYVGNMKIKFQIPSTKFQKNYKI